MRLGRLGFADGFGFGFGDWLVVVFCVWVAWRFLVCLVMGLCLGWFAWLVRGGFGELTICFVVVGWMCFPRFLVLLVV